jgi:hypothetical protein
MTRTADAVRPSFLRQEALWTAGFLAFPIAGLAGTAVAGRVDDPLAALGGGAVAGLVIGAGQVLASRGRARPASLGAGHRGRHGPRAAAGCRHRRLRHLPRRAGDHGGADRTRPRTGAGAGPAARHPPALGLAAAVPALWALGWTATTLGGISVADQLTVFGACGAVTFSALSGLVMHALVPVRAAGVRPPGPPAAAG